MFRTAPSPAKVEGGHLGLAIPGEDALPVATDAHRAAGGREVREVPDLLADDGVEGVEDPLVHLEDLDLVLLAPRLGGGLLTDFSLVFSAAPRSTVGRGPGAGQVWCRRRTR